MLRVEATELTVDVQMFAEQKRAYTRVEELIDTAVKHRKSYARANRSIFLSGVSGVGKTSVYLTLRRNSDDANPTSKESSDLYGKVAWLEPLELFDVQRKPNVLADLLVLIENKIDSEGPFLNTAKKKCIQRLQRLQNSVSLVWNASTEDIPTSNAQARAAHIVDTSRERAGLRKELNELIDEVAKEFFNDKVIILPVDDLDESYLHAFEVLRLLRLVHSSHLIILAIGDITTIKKIEEARFRSEQIGNERDSAGKQHAIMAEYSINKIIPSAQRVNIEPAETESEENWKKLKTFKPVALANGEEALPNLFDLLSTQFNDNRMTVNMDEEKRWRWLLKAPARDLVDMYHDLATIDRSVTKDDIGSELKSELKSELFILFAWAQAERAMSTIDWPNGDEAIFHNLFITKVTSVMNGMNGILKFGIHLNEQYTQEIVPPNDDGDTASCLIKIERKNGTPIQLAPLIQAWLRLCHEINIASTADTATPTLESAGDEHDAETSNDNSKTCLCLRLRWLPQEYPDGNPHAGNGFFLASP